MKTELPKGLREFGASLADPRFAGEIFPRLLDLPENGFAEVVARHREALKAVTEARRLVERREREAAEIAQGAFRQALQHWSIQEIQKATGYDND